MPTRKHLGDTDTVAVAIPHELMVRVDARARAAGLSREEAVARLITRALGAGGAGGVDRTQIAHRLRMTPAQRVATMAEESRRMLALAERVS